MKMFDQLSVFVMARNRLALFLELSCSLEQTRGKTVAMFVAVFLFFSGIQETVQFLKSFYLVIARIFFS